MLIGVKITKFSVGFRYLATNLQQNPLNVSQVSERLHAFLQYVAGVF